MSTPYGSDRPGEGRPGDGAADQPTYPAQPGYAGPGNGAAPPKPRNGLGIAALVLGILALITCVIPGVGAVLGLIALILGIVGRGRVKKRMATNGGVALTGLILGVISLIINIVVIVLAAVGFALIGGTDTVQQIQQCVTTQQAQGADPVTAQQTCAQQLQQQVTGQLGGQ